MKKWPLLCLALNACDWLSGDVDPVVQPELKRISKSDYQTGSCKVNQDCKIQAVGVGPCGLAAEFLLYNQWTTDTAKLNATIHAINLGDALQWASEIPIVSQTCSPNQPLGSAICDAGTCKYDPGFNQGSSQYEFWKPTQSYVWFKALTDSAAAQRIKLSVQGYRADTLAWISRDTLQGAKWSLTRAYTLFGDQKLSMQLQMDAEGQSQILKLQLDPKDTVYVSVQDSSLKCASVANQSIHKLIRGPWAICTSLDSL